MAAAAGGQLSMLAFLLRRIGLIIPTFIGVTIAAFAFIRILPGDPVLLMAGERGTSPERHAELMKQFGFDRPLWEQYLDYLFSALQGDLGNSLVTKKPVWDEFFTLFPATMELSFCAILFAVLLGIPAGIFAAVKRGSWFDQSIMGTALVGYSMPIFWWGLLLIILFSGTLQWTPVSGRISLLYYFPAETGFMLIVSLLSGQKGAFTSALSHLVLPSIVLATIPLAVIARQTRSAMLEVLGEESFIANDLHLNDHDRRIMILTGPNMAGKSTYLRQCALIIIMAHMGSFVPASEARIGLVDRVFSRIGASDRLIKGESTFLVEMVETSRILHYATQRSFIIMDEIGRGTSTYDGLSIAWAVLEHLLSQFFIDLVNGIARVTNYIITNCDISIDQIKTCFQPCTSDIDNGQFVLIY